MVVIGVKTLSFKLGLEGWWGEDVLLTVDKRYRTLFRAATHSILGEYYLSLTCPYATFPLDSYAALVYATL